MKCFLIATAELSFAPKTSNAKDMGLDWLYEGDARQQHKLVVPVRETVEAFVDAFGEPGIQPDRTWRKGTKMLVVIDGRMYRDVVGLIFRDAEGNGQNALE